MENNKIVFFDIDNVLIKGQSQEFLLRFLLKKRKLGFLKFLIIYAWFFIYKLNLYSKPNKIRQYSFLVFKGWKREDSRAFFNEFYEKVIKKRIISGTVSLLDEHKRNGDRIVFISATLEDIIYFLAHDLNVEEYIGTRLELRDNIFTGNFNEDLPYAEGKLKIASSYLFEHGLSFENAYAYADHITDISLLEAVHYPIVVNPDKKLRIIALSRNWKIYDF